MQCFVLLVIVHVYCRQQKSPKEDLKHCVQKLFNFENDQSQSSSAKPKVLWSLYFSAPDTSKSDLKDGVPNNVFLCPGPDLDLDYDFTIQKVICKQAKCTISRNLLFSFFMYR